MSFSTTAFSFSTSKMYNESYHFIQQWLLKATGINKSAIKIYTVVPANRLLSKMLLKWVLRLLNMLGSNLRSLHLTFSLRKKQLAATNVQLRDAWCHIKICCVCCSQKTTVKKKKKRSMSFMLMSHMIADNVCHSLRCDSGTKMGFVKSQQYLLSTIVHKF